MTYELRLKPGFLVFGSLMLLLIIAVACGDEATPTRQPTQPPPTADLSAIEDALSRVESALSRAAPAVTAEEIQDMVQAAVSGITPTGLSAEDIQSLVAMAVSDAIPEGASAEEIQALVTAAVAAAAQPGLSEEAIAALVAETVKESGLTAKDVSAIVKAAIPPTPTPAPTVTPVPTPRATPTPGFMTSTVARIVAATAPPPNETTINFQTLIGWGHMQAMYEPLFGSDRFTGEYIPELAKEWEMSPDATSWTIKIQEGVDFHAKDKNWGEFIVADVVHSWKQLTDEGFAGDAGTWIRLVNSEDDFEIIDDHTIVFNLTRPELDLVFYASSRNGSMFMISKAQWDAVGIDGMRDNPAGTGPWTLKKWNQAQSMEYDRVENHWRKTPEFREAEIKWVSEEATRLAQILTGEVHITALSRDTQKRAIEAGMKRAIGAEPQSALQGYWMGLWDQGIYGDPDKKTDTAFHDIRVRQAMFLAVDRVELNETLYDGRGTLSSVSYSYRSFPSYDTSWDERAKTMYRFDPEESKRLLADAGYGPDNPLKVKLFDIVWPGWPEFQPMGEATAQYWEEVGIDVTIDTVEYARVREGMTSQDVDWANQNAFFYFPPWFLSPRPFQVAYSYYSGQDRAYALFTDPRIDEAYDEIVKTTDLERRYELERIIDNVVFEEYGDLTLFYIPFEVVYNSSVVAQYDFPGVFTDAFSELEYAVAAR